MWRRVCDRLDDFLRNHEAAAITLLVAPERPQVNPGSGTPPRRQNVVIDLDLASVLHRSDFPVGAVGSNAED